MRNKTKKLLSFVAAATMIGSTLAMTACGGVPGGSYTGTKLEGYVSEATVAKKATTYTSSTARKITRLIIPTATL